MQSDAFLTLGAAASELCHIAGGTADQWLNVLLSDSSSLMVSQSTRATGGVPGGVSFIESDPALWTIPRFKFDAWCTAHGLGSSQSAPRAEGAEVHAPRMPRGRELKREALINAHRVQWPSVEADLKHASENGLRESAGAGRHGYWIEDAALEWARARGKLIAARGPASWVFQG